ncbi:MAG: hypothetical protein AAF289_17185 [Cyanobacteria bacterium P01_A01_bin.135]
MSRRPASPRSQPRRSFNARPRPQRPRRQPQPVAHCPCCGTDEHLQILGDRYGKRTLPSYGDLVKDWLGQSPKTRRGERLSAPNRDPVGLGCVALGGMVGAAAIGAASLPVLGVTAGVTAYARHRVNKRYRKVYAPEYRKWARSLYCEQCDIVFGPEDASV